jgi:TRAP-type C4-dicarboxylate transport system permease small subunit
MDRLIEWAHTLARWGAWGGGGLLLLAAFIIGIEVIIRKVFALSIGGAAELSAFALAISSAWAFSFTMVARAHVRIETLYVILPPRACAIIDLLVHAIVTVVIGILTWYGWVVFKNSWVLSSRTMTPVPFPLDVPQFFWLAGLVFFLLVAILLLVRAVQALLAGDFAAIQRVIGPRSITEELEEEVQQLRERSRAARTTRR